MITELDKLLINSLKDENYRNNLIFRIPNKEKERKSFSAQYNECVKDSFVGKEVTINGVAGTNMYASACLRFGTYCSSGTCKAWRETDLVNCSICDNRVKTENAVFLKRNNGEINCVDCMNIIKFL